MVLSILLGTLFFSLGDLAAESDEISKRISAIRIEDRRGFTRIVFPYERPEMISIEPHLDRHQFIVRFPETTTRIVLPHVGENHHLIKKIEILPGREKQLLLQVIVKNNHIEWVSYRYEDPPKRVLYLRTNGGPTQLVETVTDRPSSKDGGGVRTNGPKSSPRVGVRSPSGSVNSLDLTKFLMMAGVEKGPERAKASTPKSLPKSMTRDSLKTKKSSDLTKASPVKKVEKVAGARKAEKTKSSPRAADKPSVQLEKPFDLAKSEAAKTEWGIVGAKKAEIPPSPFGARNRSSVHSKESVNLANLSGPKRDKGVTKRSRVNMKETPPRALDDSYSVAETSRDPIRTPKVKRDERKTQSFWRSSADAIPEFVRVGSAYPPDFHQIKENERTLYQEALKRFRQGEFLKADRIVSKIVPKNLDSPLAEALTFFKADCDFRRAETEDAEAQAFIGAIERFREAIIRFPESRFAPDAILAMGKGYRRIKFFQEAVVQYEHFLRKFPGSPAAPEALFWKGESLFQTGRYEEAKRVFEEFARGFPRSIHGRIAGLRIGDCFYKMGDLKRARDQYGTVISESLEFSYTPLDSLFHAGLSFLKNGDLQKGREILFKAVNLDPQNEQGKGIMGAIIQSYLEENRNEEALRATLLLCENFGGEDPKGMELVRLADMRLGHPQLRWPPLFVDVYLDPVGVYQDFLDQSQDMNLSDQVMYRQALALVGRGDVHEAVTKLEKILSQRHQDLLRQRSSSLLAYALNSLIQRQHGQSAYLDVVELYKIHADFLLSDENRDKGGLLLVAESYKSLGLLEDALAVYQQLKGTRGFAEDYVLFQIGHLLSLNGDKKAAREVLAGLQENFPSSLYLGEVQKLLGDLSFDMRDYRAAIQWYRLVLARAAGRPEMGRVYVRLGRSLMATGQYQEAIAAYQGSVESVLPLQDKPWAKELLVESLSEMATYYDDQNKIPNALEYYRRIVRFASSEDKVNWALYRLGENYRKIGNLEMMKRTFDDLIDRSPDSLWSKLAVQAAGGVAFEAMVQPYLAQVVKTPSEKKSEK
jgi:tetratricopeptide (TPR) repeat protein